MRNSRHLVLALFAAAFYTQAEAGPSQSNILFILTDDQSPRSVSCYSEAYP